jgi:hypothetical protein
MPTTIDSAGITFNDSTTLTTANLPIADGAVTVVKLGTNEQKQICKAWVNFNGTTSPGTIKGSFNVSSVTKVATGSYEVNLISPLSNNLYSCVATDNSRGATVAVPSTISKFIVATYNTSFLPADFTEVSAIAFGN